MNRGLIEAGERPLPTMRSRALPRFMNRGLIEAGMNAPKLTVRRALPRFMNRGLIEAICRRNARPELGNFPDS